MAETQMLVLHVVRLDFYRGLDDGFYAKGFDWPSANDRAGELFNFKPYKGRCYGYVETGGKRLTIEKLGASRGSDRVENVLVVWTSPELGEKGGDTIVGWYKNATVHREYQKPTGPMANARSQDGNVCNYIVEAHEDDCTLLLPEDRWLKYPRGKGLPGQKPMYYPGTQMTLAAKEAEVMVRKYIAGNGDPKVAADVPVPSKKKGGKGTGYTTDPKIRRAVEDAAIKRVTEHFEAKGFAVDNRSDENLGYDLEATLGSKVLCIEVKGRGHADATFADFTLNEYRAIKRAEAGTFDGGSYRICVVTDALRKSGGKLHHFMFKRGAKLGKGAWCDLIGGGYLDLKVVEAARGTLT